MADSAGWKTQVASLSDGDLLECMALAEADPVAAREAWEQFYVRHVRYLYAVCMRAYGCMVGDAGVADLVAETFHRAYEHAGTFRPVDGDDGDLLRRRTRAWLGRIAQRLFQTLLRTRGRVATVRLSQEHWQNVAAEPPEIPAGEGASPRIRQVREAIARLTGREQTVLRVTMQWYRPDMDNQRMPEAVVAELAESLQTTPENLRQIRRRALRKIRQFLQQTPQAESEQ